MSGTTTARTAQSQVEQARVDELRIQDFPLDSGERLPRAVVRYATLGAWSPGADNVVLLFTYYTGTHNSYAPWIRPGGPIDPARYHVVVVDHLGNGVSSSPSNTPGPFPALDVADTARAAMAVLDSLGIGQVRLAAGWSLGGMQALEFAARYPRAVSAVLALCSAARCSEVNRVFLDGVDAVLGVDAVGDAPDGRAARALNAFGRVYAGWAYSEEFFREAHYRDLGYRDPADVVASWGRDHEAYDARDLRASLDMWRRADLGRHRGGLGPGLGAVRARTVLMPCATDSYFTLAENEHEFGFLPDGELSVLRSPLGHVAGRPGVRPREQAAVDECLRRLLA